MRESATKTGRPVSAMSNGQRVGGSAERARAQRPATALSQTTREARDLVSPGRSDVSAVGVREARTKAAASAAFFSVRLTLTAHS